MKTNMRAQSDKEPRHSAAAHPVIRHHSGVGVVDHRSEACAQRKLAEAIHASPVMVAQRMQLGRMFGPAAQLKGPEDEELQMKAVSAVLQRKGPEEEELLQGKFQPVQRQAPDEEELLQGKFVPVQRVEDEELLQGKFAGRLESVQFKTDRSPQENRTGMPDNLKSGIESLSGLSMDAVRVHYNSSQPPQLNALAYAQGTDIHIAPGQEQHLPHEAWHVVQQAQGRVQPTMQMKDGVSVNDDAGLEHEADVMGAKAVVSGSQGESQDTRPDRVSIRSEGLLRQRVVQCVRGGIEYTEDGPTELHAYLSPFPGNVHQHSTFTVSGRPMTGFRVGAGVDHNATLGGWTNEDLDVVRPNINVKLTNDVESAEWIIERHENDLAPDVMRQTLKNDIGFMFEARDELAAAVGTLKSGHAGEVAVTDGTKNDTSAAAKAFIYRVGPKKGKAQITAQYSNEDTVRRINKLNVSKFLTGTKVAVGEDVARISGTESPGLQQSDIAGTTSFSTAGVLLGGLVGNSNAIPRNGAVGDRLTQAQVGLVKLMVINDALATTMVRYQDLVGQAQEKNIQRFFPKSRRDEYVKTIAQANLDAVEMGALRTEIQNTSAADAQLVFNNADPGAVRTDEAFTELMNAGHAVDAVNFAVAKGRLLDPTQGPTNLAHVLGIKTAVLGVNGALLAAWIHEAARAYTDMTAAGDDHLFHDPGKVNQTAQDISDYGVGGGGVVGAVIETSRGFTPVQGRGAVYEMREREIDIDKSGWLNIGSMKDINDAIDKIFGAAG